MAQSIDLYIRLQEAQARQNLQRLDQEIQRTQQAAARQVVLQVDSTGATKQIAQYNDEIGRTITLIERTREAWVGRGEDRHLETVTTQTRQIKENYERIAMEAQAAAQQAERLAQATQRAQTAFERSLSGDARVNYQGGIISAQEAIAQTSRTKGMSASEWQQIYNALNGVTQQCGVAAKEVSIFGEMSEAAFNAYSTGAMRAEDVMTSMQRTQSLSAQGWQEYYNTINRIGDSCGVTANEVSVFGQLSDAAFAQYSSGAMSADEANKHLTRSVEETGTQAEITSNKIGFLNTVLLRLGHTAISTVIRSLREAVEEMKNVDTELVVVRKVTDFSDEKLESIRKHSYEIGKEYGVSASQYLESVAELSRAGYREQSEGLAELAVKLQIVGDVTQETANQFLIATDKAYGFNGNVQELSNTIDQLNEIDNNFATSIQKMADGMGLVAPVASQAHVSITELEAALGTITATTQRSGAESARALRALFLNIMNDTTTEIEDNVTWTKEEIESLQDVLKIYAKDAVQAAEATGTLINPMKAIEGLAKSYKEGLLTEAKLTQMVYGIGGKLRSSQLLALIQNWEMYEEMLAMTGEAIGSADKEVERALDSWERKVEILKNTWTDFVQKSFSTDMFKGLLDFATKALNIFDNLGTVLGLLAMSQIPNVVVSLTSLGRTIHNISQWSTALGGGFSGLSATLTNFKYLSNAASQGADQLSKSLQNVNVGASNAAVGIGAAIAIISVAIIAWKGYVNSLNEKISAAQSAKDSLDSLQQLKEKYENLSEALKNGEITSEEYVSARDAVIEKLKDEGVWVDSITGKYSTLNEKIEAATEAALGYRKVELYDALEAAEKKIKDKTAWDTDGGLYDIVDQWIYGRSRRYDNGVWHVEEITIKGLIDLYDKAKDRRAELLESGGRGSPEDKALERFIDYYGDVIEDYKSVYGIINQTTEATEEATEVNDELIDSIEDVTDAVEEEKTAFVGLKDEIEGATKALQKYKDATANGEHGDTLREYAEIYKTAKELYEKGYFGSTQYQAALDILLPDIVKKEHGYDYKELGEQVFGEFANGAWEALYGSEGADNGAILATYLRDNAKGMAGIYEVINDNGETFDLLIHDEEALANALGMTTEQIYAFEDGLDIMHSDVMLSTKDVTELIKMYGDLSSGVITDSVGMIRQLVKDGRTESEIRNIINQLERAGQLDAGSLPEDLSGAIEKFQELSKEEEELPDNLTIEVCTDPESGYFDEVLDEIKTVNEQKIVIGVRYKYENSSPSTTPSDITPSSNNTTPSSDITYTTRAVWQGVTSAKAGTSLINEDGAELIVRGKQAFIANDGKPTLFNLKTGDRVFNAKETQAIFGQSVATGLGGVGTNIGNTTSTIAGGITATYPTTDDDNNDKKTTDTGKKKNPSDSVDNSDLLSMLSDYIKELLDKAKKALDAQIDAIDAQIEALKKQHDAEEEANELEELRLKILEAEKNLVDANVERTVRYFNKATGQWEWMADQKAVAEAQKALEDAQQSYYDKLADMEYQAKLDELNAQKDALKASYNALSDNWNDIKDEISKALNGKDVLSLAEILTRLGLTAASGSVGGVNSLIASINAFTGSFDNGGFAFGKGFLLKGISQGETILDESITDRILSPKSNSQFTNFTNSLTKLFGMSSGDIGAKAQSLINSIDRSSNISGDTYYINGVRIGSDMMDRPLSEILSVLPIYAS